MPLIYKNFPLPDSNLNSHISYLSLSPPSYLDNYRQKNYTNEKNRCCINSQQKYKFSGIKVISWILKQLNYCRK